MVPIRSVLLTSLILSLCSGAALAQGAKPMVTLQMPALPDPARVTLAPATTGVLLDGRRPRR